MIKENIFDGDSYSALFAQIVYKRIVSREWFTYADIMAEHLGLDSAEELPCNVSKCDYYGELKKTFGKLRNAIRSKLGQDLIEEDGNNRNKRYRYIGTDDDPLADLRNAKVINDLKQYWQFCQDSAGFFPTSWLEYFFKDSRDLLDIKIKKQKGEQVLSVSLDRMLTNIELLPSLYEAIIRKQVLSIDYKPYEDEKRTLIFHPHFLKEYNGRWHLFGHADERVPEFGYNLALDRIVGKPREVYKQDYVTAPSGYYEKYFKDIVGVTHGLNSKIENVHLRAHSKKMFGLTETKKIHWTQETVIPYGKHEDGEYGEFSLQVEINDEFIGRILQMGDGLEIVSPLEVRKEFKQRVGKMVKLYE